MIIHKTSLIDAVLVEATPFSDHRGIFARFFCSRELYEVLDGRSIVNVNFSRTVKKGSVRGMHFQRPPHAEMKFVRCIRGEVYDVIVDIRPDSPTFLKWHGEILSAENIKMLAVPEGFAHGFQALEPNSEILYLTTEFYDTPTEGGLRYNDPVLAIQWPLPVTDISEKDNSHSLLKMGCAIPGAGCSTALHVI